MKIHLEKWEKKQEEMESILKDQALKQENNAFDLEMHYGIILRFSRLSQFVVRQPMLSMGLVKGIGGEEETMQQTTIALADQTTL